MRSFNHIIEFSSNIYSLLLLSGIFYHNYLTGDMYCISKYGIIKFEFNNILWHLNDIDVIEKFFEQPAISKIHERMGI